MASHCKRYRFARTAKTFLWKILYQRPKYVTYHTKVPGYEMEFGGNRELQEWLERLLYPRPKRVPCYNEAGSSKKQVPGYEMEFGGNRELKAWLNKFH